ncbi:unnamed protein product [Prunus brigantina]
MAGGREMNEATGEGGSRLGLREKKPRRPRGGAGEHRRPRKVVPFVNAFIDGAQMELPELEQLPMKSVRERAGRAFRVRGAVSMWLGMKRAVNAAERAQKRFEDGRAKIAEAGKMLQDADRHAAENAAKIAELSSKLAEAEKAAVDAEEARARAEAAKEDALRSRATEVEEAKKRAVEEYRSSEEFTAFAGQGGDGAV